MGLCGPEVIYSRQLPVVVNAVRLKLVCFFPPLIIIENCSQSRGPIILDAVRSYSSISPALWAKWPVILKRGGLGSSHSVTTGWISAWAGLFKHATAPLPKCSIIIPGVSWADAGKDPRHCFSTYRKDWYRLVCLHCETQWEKRRCLPWGTRTLR